MFVFGLECSENLAILTAVSIPLWRYGIGDPTPPRDGCNRRPGQGPDTQLALFCNTGLGRFDPYNSGLRLRVHTSLEVFGARRHRGKYAGPEIGMTRPADRPRRCALQWAVFFLG